jgi:hypothetical protein
VKVGVGSGEGEGSGAGRETTALTEFEEGIRITRASGLGETGWEEIMLVWDEARRFAMPFRTPKPVIDLRPPSSPNDIGWCTAFPRAIQLMLSTSC